MGKGIDKGSAGGQGHSSKDTGKGKEKEKGIIIKEPVLQSKQATASKGAPQSKKDGKRKVRKSAEALPIARPRIESTEGATILPVSIVPATDEILVIHPHPLFETMIPFNKDAHVPSKTSASLLSNPMYNLKLARSIVPVPDCQFAMRRSMATNLTELIDLNMKVNIIAMCSLMLCCFYSHFWLCFQMTAFLVGVANLHRYTQLEWEMSTNSYKAVVVKAEKEKVKQEKETFESQFAVLESEKTTLNKVVEEAKTARDEAVAMANSLKLK